MRTWDAFFADVLPDVLGCPEPTAERHILRAARRFCEKTGVWRQDLDRITTRDGKSIYDLPLPTGGEVVRILGGSLAGCDIDVAGADDSTTAQRRRGTGGRNRVLSRDGFSVVLLPTPAADQELFLEAWLQPSQSATGLPNAIADKYLSEIAGGALATLLLVNKAPWANPGLADRKERDFAAAIGQAKKDAWKAYTANTPRARAQFF